MSCSFPICSLVSLWPSERDWGIDAANFIHFITSNRGRERDLAMNQNWDNDIMGKDMSALTLFRFWNPSALWRHNARSRTPTSPDCICEDFATVWDQGIVTDNSTYSLGDHQSTSMTFKVKVKFKVITDLKDFGSWFSFNYPSARNEVTVIYIMFVTFIGQGHCN